VAFSLTTRSIPITPSIWLGISSLIDTMASIRGTLEVQMAVK